MVKQIQVMKTAFQSDDGKTYDTEIDAARADEAFRAESDHVFHFSRTHSGQALLKKHNLSDFGVWRVEGEDANCDMGGYRDTPLLGYFEGTLEQVINYTYTLDRWMTWGGGGNITKTEPKKVIKL